MPLVKTSTYRAPFFTRNSHVGTILPVFLNKFKSVNYDRERIQTSDQDFIDLDWLRNSSDQLALLCHGLEGSSQSQYMQRTMKAFHKRGWDTCAFNYRGCSGEQNLAVKSYHSGFTEDLEEVLEHLHAKGQYKKIVLVGFSLGGNLVLKYAGEKSDTIYPSIEKVIAVGSPVDLQSSCDVIHDLQNTLYRTSFVNSLLAKIKAREAIIAPTGIDIAKLLKVKTLHEYDDMYTSQVHGFKDAKDYYAKASSLPYLSNIKIPSLLINATNDTFLDEPSYPIAIAEKSKHFYLEIPKHGGHIGFLSFDGSGEYWIQQRILAFAEMGF